MGAKVPLQITPQPDPNAPMQRQIPIERMLARYGQTHLQLVEAEEEVKRASQLIQHFQAKVTELAKEIVDKNAELEKVKAELASIQERLSKYEPPQEPKAEAGEAVSAAAN